jgi:uncharacterized protein (TIGR03437 family)
MHRISLTLLLMATQPFYTFAANFSYTGTFAQDDETRQFNFTLAQAAQVTVRTFSYAGGMNAAGVQIPRGGFDPTLTLFDSKGNFVAFNQDGGCGAVAADLVTAFCFDSYMQIQLPAGSWQLVLTESENLPNGPTLADSFVYAGAGDFTSDPNGSTNPGFWDYFPNQRTGNYAVDIIGADASQTPLNPQVAGLLNAGSYISGDAAPNTILSLFDSQINADPTVTATVAGLPAQILYAGPTQINFVIPPNATPADGVALEILRGHDMLLSTQINIVDAFPALFTSTETGTGQVAAINVINSGAVSYNGAKSPAARGGYVELFGTGFGAANPPGSDGLSWLAEGVTATIGGVPAQVSFAGLAPNYTTGLQQINLQIPEDCPTGSAISIRLQVGSHNTQAGTTLAIQ